MRKIYSILLFFSMDLFALDVETLPGLRTRQYDSGAIEKIIIFSAPRNGSSLVFNVFKYFFEHTDSLLLPHRPDDPSRMVFKTHDCRYFGLCPKETSLFIVPIRHPLEAAISHARVGAAASLPDRKRAKELINKQVSRLIEAKNRQLEGFQIVFLPYELFANNMNFLLEEIERLFSLSLDERDKKIILQGYSKENIALAVQSLENFKQYLPISGFHGCHISPDALPLSDDLLFWLDVYFSGYESANIE